MPCDPKMLADVELFAHLSESDRTRLADVVDRRVLAGGTVLFNAGEPGDSLFAVKRGEVELYIKDTAGQRIVLAIASPGEVFGEVALLDRGPRSATAFALTECELIEVERDDLLVLFTKSPAAALQLLAAMGKKTRKADELLKTRVVRNVNEEIQEKTSAFDRVADSISAFSSSMPFLVLIALASFAWALVNSIHLGMPWFDPHPYDILALSTGLLSLFLTCFVLISQTRQSRKDHLKADIEYEINVKAELEVAHLHEKTDRIYTEMLDHFMRLERTIGARADTPSS
jgi:uncharacterized membrane protein